MRYVVLRGGDEVARRAVEEIAALVCRTPDAVIAVPTGRTPRAMYDELAQAAASGRMDLSRVRWFALDEFLGAVPAAATFGHFLRQRLVAACRVPEQCLHVLHAGCADPVQEGARYEAEIAAAGGLDLAILGIGENGHIGFNEPGTPFCSRTGHRLLDEKTRRANAYLFARLEDVPVQGISMGIGTILSARAVLLLAVGAGKAEVMERLAAASPEPSLPASALKTHGNVLAVMDEEAAGSTRL